MNMLNEKIKGNLECSEFRRRFIQHFKINVCTKANVEDTLIAIELEACSNPKKWERIFEVVNSPREIEGSNALSYDSILEKIEFYFQEHENWKIFESGPAELTNYELLLEETAEAKAPRHFYVEENVGKYYLSIDVASANFQTINKIFTHKKDIKNVEEDYKEFVSRFTPYHIPLISKKFRTQILAGATSHKWNKYFVIKNVDEILNVLESIFDVTLRRTLSALFADEFIIEIDKDFFSKLNNTNLKLVENMLRYITGTVYHIDPFYLEACENNKIYAKINSNGIQYKYASKAENLVLNLINAGAEQRIKCAQSIKGSDICDNTLKSLRDFNDKMLDKFMKICFC